MATTTNNKLVVGKATTKRRNKNTVSKREHMPTGRDISLALCKIDDYENYSDEEIIESLDSLCGWVKLDCSSIRDRIRQRVLLEEMIDHGGIPRILDFIKRNTDEVDFIVSATEVLATFTYPGRDDEFIESTSRAVSKFVQRGGVEFLLFMADRKTKNGKLAINDLYTLLCTLGNIWSLFGHIVYSMNRKNMVDMDTIYPMIDSGISTMNVLNKIRHHDDTVALIKDNIFLAIGYIMENADLINEKKLHKKDIFRKCVDALKNPVDGSWKYDRMIWANASWFFYECCKQNRTILSREADFEVIIPFLVQFMKEDPNYACEYWAAHVLRKACAAMEDNKSLEWAHMLKKETMTLKSA